MTITNVGGWSIIGLTLIFFLLMGFYVAVTHEIGWLEAVLLFVGLVCATPLVIYAMQLIRT